jgi:hypothetical protein
MASNDPTSAFLSVLRGISRLLCLCFVSSVAFCSICLLSAASRAGEIDFEKQIAPILSANCLRCHNKSKARAGLDLSTRESVFKGSDTGEVLVSGKPEESLLVKRAEDGSMPPETDGRRLTAVEVAVLRAWIGAGAQWPEGRVLSAVELQTETSAKVSPRQRRASRPLIHRRKRNYFHSGRNLSAAVHRGPRPVRARVGGAGTPAVEPVGKRPAAPAARQAEGHKRQGGDHHQFSHGSSPISKTPWAG